MIEKRMRKVQVHSITMSSALVTDLLGHADTRVAENTCARTRHEGMMKQQRAVENWNAFL